MGLFDFLKKKEPQKSNDNPYLDMRGMAFSMTPEQLGLNTDQDNQTVFGLVVELGMQGGTATLITFITGDTSMYFSSGGGIIGAGQHESVVTISNQLIQHAHDLLGKGNRIENVYLPESREVNFILLTNRGKEIITEHMSALENGMSPYSNFFGLTNMLMSEIRMKSQG